MNLAWLAPGCPELGTAQPQLVDTVIKAMKTALNILIILMFLLNNISCMQKNFQSFNK
jgi:hypothetical protein